MISGYVLFYIEQVNLNTTKKITFCVQKSTLIKIKKKKERNKLNIKMKIYHLLLLSTSNSNVILYLRIQALILLCIVAICSFLSLIIIPIGFPTLVDFFCSVSVNWFCFPLSNIYCTHVKIFIYSAWCNRFWDNNYLSLQEKS